MFLSFKSPDISSRVVFIRGIQFNVEDNLTKKNYTYLKHKSTIYLLQGLVVQSM